MKCIIISALIITGGESSSSRGHTLDSVEVYQPGTRTSCTLPPFPAKVKVHTQDGLVLCGGFQGGRRAKSCYTLSTDTGKWTKTHQLRDVRGEHNSWRREDGSIVLLAGDYSNTTEVLSKSNGFTTAPGFDLKYRIV